MVAAGVAGAALIAGGPAAVWIVSQQEYGGDTKAEQRHPERDGFRRAPLRPPRGEMRDRAEELRRLVEWSRCVLREARGADGPVDLDKLCGEAPDVGGPGGPIRIPEHPDDDPDY